MSDQTPTAEKDARTTGHAWVDGRCVNCDTEKPRPWAEPCPNADYDALVCQGADFSRVAAHLANGLHEHADRDGLRGVMRAVFLDRGGHAPGEACPSAEPHSCDLPSVSVWLDSEGDASLTCPSCGTSWAPAWGSGSGDSSGWTRVIPPGEGDRS